MRIVVDDPEVQGIIPGDLYMVVDDYRDKGRMGTTFPANVSTAKITITIFLNAIKKDLV